MNKTNHKEQINKSITQNVTKKAPTVQNKQTTLVTGSISLLTWMKTWMILHLHPGLLGRDLVRVEGAEIFLLLNTNNEYYTSMELSRINE